MYHAHFGLQKGLFGDGIAADTAVFRSAKHDQVSAHFKLALGSPNACVVLRGPAGIGKTTLTAATLRASATRLALAWLNGMPTNPTELLELLLVELGINTVRTTRMERLQLWRQFQGEMRATETRLFVVVERTEDLSTEVLHALDQLTAPDAVGNPGANVVLLGHATIDEHLAAPLLESLRQRIRARTDLAPFTEPELQDYLRHQVACAGGHYDRIFAPGTVAALYRYSGGVARLANTVCESALDVAAVQRQPLLTPELLTKTAVSLLGLADTVSPTRVAPPAASRETVPVAAAPPPAAAAPTMPSSVPAAPVATISPTPSPAPMAVPVATSILVPPVATAPPTPAAVPTPIPAPSVVTAASAQSPSPALVQAPIPVVAAAAVWVAPRSAEPATTPAPTMTATNAEPVEFDGGATDITDVAMADFPVLTDAVELPAVVALAKRPTAAPAVQAEPAAVTPPAPIVTPAAVSRAAPPAKPAASRVETAYTASKTAATAPPAPKPAPAALPTPVAATPPAAPVRTPPTDPSADDDLLRQTQTMRAIAVAKSIDDISSSMAETLFGDAELDLVTAALASAAEWPDDDVQTVPAPSKPEAPKTAARPEPPPAKTPLAADDPFDLFGLGDDAPLELIDDSTLPPIDQSRKRAAR